MTQNTRRSLVVIQTLIAILTVLMFVLGLFGIKAMEKIEEQRQKPFDVSFEEKMRPLIGKPYTEERHYELLELTRFHDDANTSSIKSLAAASEVMRNLGGILALGALASIFLLLKKPLHSAASK